MLLASSAAAHGLLVSIHGEGGFITGKVFYTDGTLGSDEYAELTDLSVPGAAPLKGKTDAMGGFRFPGLPGHRYRFLTEGEEGHTTEMRITLAPGAKGKFVDHDAAPGKGRLPPAWAVLGGLLLLVTAPVLVFRRRINPKP